MWLADVSSQVFPRKGGDPDWAPAFAGEQGQALTAGGTPVSMADLHDPPPPGGGGRRQPDGGGGGDNLGSVSAPSVACGATFPWRGRISTLSPGDDRRTSYATFQ